MLEKALKPSVKVLNPQTLRKDSLLCAFSHFISFFLGPINGILNLTLIQGLRLWVKIVVSICGSIKDFKTCCYWMAHKLRLGNDGLVQHQFLAQKSYASALMAAVKIKDELFDVLGQLH